MVSTLTAFNIYLAAYLVVWKLHQTTQVGFWLFWIIHLSVASWAMLRWRGRLNSVDKKVLLCWGIMFLLFLIPGAYLEYPSDPWTHFQRLTAWDTALRIQDVYADRLTYFWGWTFLVLVPVAHKILALDVYSAFWQWLLAIQVFRWARSLGQSTSLAWLQVVGFFVLFGTNLFSFRYYALSSTPLAYIAYIQSFIWFHQGLEARSLVRCLRSLTLLPLIVYDHPQALAYWGLSHGVLLGYYAWNEYAPALRQRLWPRALLLLAGLGGASVGWLAITLAPELYDHVGRENVSEWGSLKIWMPWTSHWETLGISGLLALVVAVVRWRRTPLLSALTLAPSLVLLYPLSALAISVAAPDFYITYRMLFAFPVSFMLVEVIDAGTRGLIERYVPATRTFAWASALLLILLLAAPPHRPWRGRLLFQFYPSSDASELSAQRLAAEWIKEHRTFDSQHPLFTDPKTQFALLTFLGLDASEQFRYHRLDGQSFISWQTPFAGPGAGREMMEHLASLGFAGLLIIVPDQVPRHQPTFIGQLSGHWGDSPSDLAGFYSPALLETGRLFAQTNGWTVTRVPPFYLLYEPPGSVGGR